MKDIAKKMLPLKMQLRYLEKEGLNAGPTCRQLAVLTQDLTLMEIRQSQVFYDSHVLPKAFCDGPTSSS